MRPPSVALFEAVRASPAEVLVRVAGRLPPSSVAGGELPRLVVDDGAQTRAYACLEGAGEAHAASGAYRLAYRIPAGELTGRPAFALEAGGQTHPLPAPRERHLRRPGPASDLVERVSEAEGRQDAAERQAAQAQAEVAELRPKLAAAAQRVQALEEELGAARRRADEAALAGRRELEAETRRRRTAETRAAAPAEARDAARPAPHGQQRAVADAALERRAAEATIAEARQGIARLEARTAQLEADLTLAHRARDEAAERIAGLEARAEQSERAEAERTGQLGDAERRAAEAERSRDELAARLETAQRDARAAQDDLGERLSAAADAGRTLEAERDAARADAARLAARVDALEPELAGARSDADRAKERAAAAEQAAGRAERQVVEARDDAVRRAHERDAARQDLDRLAGERDAALHDRDEASAERDRLTAAAAALEAQVAEHRERIARLEQSLADSEAARDAADGERVALLMFGENALREREDLAAELARTGEALEASRDELDRLRSEQGLPAAELTRVVAFAARGAARSQMLEGRLRELRAALQRQLEQPVPAGAPGDRPEPAAVEDAATPLPLQG